MSKKYIALLMLFGIVSISYFWIGNAKAQKAVSAGPGSYMKEGVIHRNGNSAVLMVNDPRPMAQAIQALAEEYGWVVDYEDPPYISEVIDVAPHDWRRTHPMSKGGHIPGGGSFQFDYDEGATGAGTSGEKNILEKLASAYNLTGNPGKFEMISQSANRYTVIGRSIKDENGIDKEVPSVLDTPITIPLQSRSVGETVNLILTELSLASKATVSTPYPLENITTQITVGGANVKARSLLIQAFEASKRPFTYRLLYDADNQIYFLNLSVAVQSTTDTFGRKSYVPIDRIR